jgi:hypothetical protein
MNLKKIVRNSGVASALFLTAQSAMAALPADVTAAVTAAKTDGTELGYALLGMAVVVGVIFWLKRKA